MNNQVDKNHMINSIDEEKTFNKIQHHFMMKALKMPGPEGTQLTIIHTMCEKSMANFVVIKKPVFP